MTVGELKAALEGMGDSRLVTFDPGREGKAALCKDELWTFAVVSVGEDREGNVELRNYRGEDT